MRYEIVYMCVKLIFSHTYIMTDITIIDVLFKLIGIQVKILTSGSQLIMSCASGESIGPV